jgi:hypothetical protein
VYNTSMHQTSSLEPVSVRHLVPHRTCLVNFRQTHISALRNSRYARLGHTGPVRSLRVRCTPDAKVHSSATARVSALLHESSATSGGAPDIFGAATVSTTSSDSKPFCKCANSSRVPPTCACELAFHKHFSKDFLLLLTMPLNLSIVCKVRSLKWH